MNQAIGQAALRAHLKLRVPSPAVESYVTNGGRRTEVSAGRITELYRLRDAPEDTLLGHLRFALKREPLDFSVLAPALRSMPPALIVDWVQREPTGGLSRRAWFFYETFTGARLPLPNAKTGNYVSALDPRLHVVGGRRDAPRQRVIDNLLGGRQLCPTVRQTPRLRTAMSAHYDQQARRLTHQVPPEVLERAVRYLYTKETRSSFGIEGEDPSPDREERFVRALSHASEVDPASKLALLDIQGAIVDPRYRATDWRSTQVFVGEVSRGYRQIIHFVGPRPMDVPRLMDGWKEVVQRARDAALDPVIAAAVVAFAFVFIHPFEDGNGRIHRLLIHQILAQREFSPPGVIFPVSASILRDRRGYDAVLASFDAERLPLIEFRLTPEEEVLVLNDTADLYSYFDATAFAEYLYDRVADTTNVDLPDELAYVAVYDRVLAAVRAVTDMPDRRASLLTRLLLQNGGRLAERRRSQFAEIRDEELSRMQAIAQAALADAPDGVTWGTAGA